MKHKNDTKWFYPFAIKLSEYLEKAHGDNYSCAYQDVCDDRVHEGYNVWNDDGKQEVLHVIMHRYTETIAFFTFDKSRKIIKL